MVSQEPLIPLLPEIGLEMALPGSEFFALDLGSWITAMGSGMDVETSLLRIDVWVPLAMRKMILLLETGWETGLSESGFIATAPGSWITAMGSGMGAGISLLRTDVWVPLAVWGETCLLSATGSGTGLPGLGFIGPPPGSWIMAMGSGMGAGISLRRTGVWGHSEVTSWALYMIFL
jgi:hypothetical protein